MGTPYYARGNAYRHPGILALVERGPEAAYDRSEVMLGILGGGISALSLAYLYGGSCEILEKEQRVGGHCRTHEKDGFKYDEGGHILFSRDPDVLQRMVKVLGDNIARHYRNNKIWFKGRFVKYPFENGLGDLDPEDRFECLYHYINNNFPEPTNFKEWIYYTFGAGIAERYLLPYNRKIWKRDPADIGLDWVGGRVPRPPLEDVVKSAVGVSTEGYTHQLYFYYPKQGGFESLVTALESTIRGHSRITTGFAVNRVRRTPHGWVVSDGIRERVFDRLVCTMPVQHLLAALDDVPTEVQLAAAALQYNPNLIVLVGLTDCLAKNQVAVYFPDPDLVFHRVCFYHVYGGDCVPPGMYSAVAEITTPGERGIWLENDQEIASRVVDDLVREGFIKHSSVVTTDVCRVKYSYVVYDLDYKRNVEFVRAYVRSLGIELLGRFAEFEYLNTDQCFARAMKLATQLQESRAR
jgi:protoporphyrinogen oxidase